MTWSPPALPLGGAQLDVVGFGEPMVLMQPVAGSDLAEADSFEVHVAGGAALLK